MRVKLLLSLLLIGSPIISKTAQADTSTSVSTKDPVWKLLNINSFNSYLKSEERYKPSVDFMQSIAGLPERLKEERLQDWLYEKDRAFLRSLAWWGIVWRIFFAMTLITVFMYFLGGWALGVIKKLYKTVKTLIYGRDPNAPIEPTMLGNLARSALPALVRIPYLGEFLNNFFTDMLDRNNAAAHANIGDRMGNYLDLSSSGQGTFAMVMKGISIVSMLGSIGFIWVPIRQFIRLLGKIYVLGRFYYDPYFENPLERQEMLYMKSLYLFSPKQQKTIVTLILNTRAGDGGKISELDLFIRMHRALPYGVKPVEYNQKVIDEYFSTYSEEAKKYAEQLISLLVIRSRAIEAGKEYLFYDLIIKAILLYGPPGTGKSRFFKMVCRAVDLNPIHLFIMDPDVDIQGKAGAKIGQGSASALARACLDAADKNGRTYLNFPLLMEEVDKPLDENSSMRGSVSAFYHVLFDPKTFALKDDYLHTYIPKPFAIYATTNYLKNLPEAIVDRFSTFFMKSIPKQVKKKIAREIIVPLWVEAITDPEIGQFHGGTLSKEACEDIIYEKVEEYIEKSDEPGMRGTEDLAKRIALDILVAAYKNRSNIRTYVREVEAWRKQQKALGKEIPWNEGDVKDVIKDEEREAYDLAWEYWEFNDAQSSMQWYPPEKEVKERIEVVVEDPKYDEEEDDDDSEDDDDDEEEDDDDDDDSEDDDEEEDDDE